MRIKSFVVGCQTITDVSQYSTCPVLWWVVDMSTEKKRQLYKMIFYLLSDDYVPSVSVTVSTTG